MSEPTPGSNTVDRRMALAREWDELVEQVRKLEGFEDFLMPPKLETLLPAADRGPVVIVNVSRWRCDGLIVRPDGVTVRPLEQLTLAETTDQANRYLAALQEAESADIQRLEARTVRPDESPRSAARRRLHADLAVEQAQKRVDEMLLNLQEWMWRTVAEPILDELGLTAAPQGDTATWPRIWWCPTGPLTLLPLHTAGHHVEAAAGASPPRTVLDRVVSSYTPTLRALVEARRPRDGNAAEGPDRMLLVDVPDPAGQVPLDTSAERTVLLDVFTPERRTVLEGEFATRDAARAALPEHRWVHFSCHGQQHLDDPSRGGLLLRDATLTIADITESRFHGDFAGLSACKTAVGGVDLLDEAITLAAALHYTGYRHVVAALWSVDSDTSAEVFTELYREVVTDGRMEPDRAPAALHRAVRSLRDRHPDWPHRWTPFTHTGP